ncbi:MAG TPA: hypothetical protein VIT91_20590 [Chthoniobacterales bacterium]
MRKSTRKFDSWTLSLVSAVMAGIFAYTSCAPITAEHPATTGGRVARADFMLNGLVGKTSSNVPDNYIPPVPYPYTQYTY